MLDGWLDDSEDDSRVKSVELCASEDTMEEDGMLETPDEDGELSIVEEHETMVSHSVTADPDAKIYEMRPVAETVTVKVLALSLPLAEVTVTSGRSQDVELGERPLLDGAAVEVIVKDVEEMGCNFCRLVSMILGGGINLHGKPQSDLLYGGRYLSSSSSCQHRPAKGLLSRVPNKRNPRSW